MDPFLENQEVLRSAILDLQPTAYWPMDDGSGPLRDVAGGWSAAVTGSPSRVAAPSPIGSGWTFSGTGQYATSSTSIPNVAATISAVVWFRGTPSTAAEHRLFGRRAAGQHAWGLNLAVTTGNAEFLLHQAGGATHAAASVAGPLNDNRWRMLAGTFDATTIRIFLDATTASSTSLSGSWYVASTAAVSVCNSVNPAAATMAHAAYWKDRALSPAELLWLYSIGAGS